MLSKHLLPSYVPVLCALLTSFCFTSRILTARKLVTKEYGIGFDTTKLMMTTYLLANLVFLALAIIYWSYYATLDKYLLIMGTLSAVLDCVVHNLVYIALGRGPGGPITALFSMSSVGVVIIESVRFLKVPGWL